MDRIEAPVAAMKDTARANEAVKADLAGSDFLEDFIADKSRRPGLQKFEHRLIPEQNVGTERWNKSIELLNGSVSASAKGAKGLTWGAEMWEAAYSRSQTSNALLLDVFGSCWIRVDSCWIRGWIRFTGMRDVMLQKVSRLFGLKLAGPLSFS